MMIVICKAKSYININGPFGTFPIDYNSRCMAFIITQIKLMNPTQEDQQISEEDYQACKNLIKSVVNMRLEYEHTRYMATLAKELKKRPLKNAKNKRQWSSHPLHYPFFPSYIHNHYLYKPFKSHEERLGVPPSHEFLDTSCKDLRGFCAGVQSAFPLRFFAGFREEDDQNVHLSLFSDKQLKKKIDKKRFSFKKAKHLASFLSKPSQ